MIKGRFYDSDMQSLSMEVGLATTYTAGTNLFEALALEGKFVLAYYYHRENKKLRAKIFDNCGLILVDEFNVVPDTTATRWLFKLVRLSDTR